MASCSEERERVIRAGGEVKLQFDTWRVGPAALQVNLILCLSNFCMVCAIWSILKTQSIVVPQVTRSIGDDDLKPYVTAEPGITETSLSAEDEYIVRHIDHLCQDYFR